MYWFQKRCYKTLEDAIIAYEEYKKNERILNNEGLALLPHNLNFHNHYQEVVPGIIEKIIAYDTLGNKIATWGTPSQNNTRVSTYVDFGPPGIPNAPNIPIKCGCLTRRKNGFIWQIITNIKQLRQKIIKI